MNNCPKNLCVVSQSGSKATCHKAGRNVVQYYCRLWLHNVQELCLFSADFLKGEVKSKRSKLSFAQVLIDFISPEVYIKSILEGAATVYFAILNNLNTFKLRQEQTVEDEWEFCF